MDERARPRGGIVPVGEDGRFTLWGALVLHGAFGLFMGFGAKLIWWLRTGELPAHGSLAYGFLFASYHTVASAVLHLAVLRRWPWAGRLKWWLLLGTAGVGLLFIGMRWCGDQGVLPLLGQPPNYPPDTGFGSFALDNLVYALMALGYGALVFLVERQFVQQRERVELAYREKLSELDMLRARMAPHFLYNTLNNLYALAERRDERIGPSILDMAELMRYIGKHQAQHVRLEQELEQVERYVALQRLRYERPVRMVIDVAVEAHVARIPAMVLLPLVENAFKHGDPCDPAAPVVLAAAVADGRITLTCTNRIAGHAHEDPPGTGCANLQRRLELLYGHEVQIFFGAMGDRTFKAELVFPIDR